MEDIKDFVKEIIQILPIITKKFLKLSTDVLSKGRITLPQLLMLDFLSKQKDVKMKDIAKFLEVTTANATGLVDRLVRDKYINRVYDENDRRIIKLELTKKGKDLIDSINKKREKIFIEIFSKLSKEDREVYLRIVKKIKEILENINLNEKV